MYKRQVRVRASRSASAIKAPPNKADIGTTSLWEEPKIRRTTCGAIRSIKPITPAKATEAPVSSADKPMRISLVR